MPIPASYLVETFENPTPPGAELLRVITSDQIELRAAFWKGKSVSRGTVLIMQGRAEFIEKYFEVISELLDRGFAVASFDWRGQGGSGRLLANSRKGHVPHFDDFRQDLLAILDAIYAAGLPRPLYGLAHSMGACIALLGASESWLPIDGLIACAPMIGLRGIRPFLVRQIASAWKRFGLGNRLIPGGQIYSSLTKPFKGNQLSTDERRYFRNSLLAEAMGAGAIGSPTVGWLVAAAQAMKRLGDFREQIQVPTLIIGAGDDSICSTKAAILFTEALISVRYVEIAGARHEILMETEIIRQAFWRAFDSFIPVNERSRVTTLPLLRIVEEA